MTRILPAILAALLVAGCGDKPAEKKAAPPTVITTTRPQAIALEAIERTLGTLEAIMDPKIAAEVAGKVVAVNARGGQAVRKGQLLARLDPADASNQAAADGSEVARLEALLAQQDRLVARQTELVQKNFLSKNALDDVTAQRDALKNQLAAARSRGAISQGNVGKTSVVAPFDGVIEFQIASAGDYVRVGDPLFRLVSNQRLRVNLPFPESKATLLKVGMPVRLISPLAPDTPITGVLEDIRPTVLEGSRAVEAIARIDNPGPLKAGSSVNAEVITSHKGNALMVPEQAVVLRPAGKVVYIIADGKARQQMVETGYRQKGLVEITAGLKGDEIIAADGASFLSQGAAVAVKGAAAGENKETPATEPAK